MQTAGYSLVEILVVMVILALAAAAFSYQFPRRMAAVTSMEFSKKLISIFIEQRLIAIQTGNTTQISFHFQTEPGEIKTSGTHYQIPKNLEIQMVTGKQLLKVPKSTVLEFNPDGSSTGTHLKITGTNNTIYTIEVNWLTGIPVLKDISDE